MNQAAKITNLLSAAFVVVSLFAAYHGLTTGQSDHFVARHVVARTSEEA